MNKEIDALQKLNDIKEKNLNYIIENKILKSTCQFYRINDKGKHEGFASGILFTIENNYFLISAAHVLDKYMSIFLMINYEDLKVGGTLYLTKIPENKIRKDDKIDIGIFHLDELSVNLIKKEYTFLTLNDIEINQNVFDVEILPHFMIVGFPASHKQTKISHTTFYRQSAFVFISQPVDNMLVFDNFNFTNKTNLLINYDSECVEDIKRDTFKSHDISGISGCGLWRINSYYPKKIDDMVKLIGIIIEDDFNKEFSFIAGTRLDILIEFLRYKFEYKIPNSKYIDTDYIKTIF